jgi:carbamoyltransferase
MIMITVGLHVGHDSGCAIFKDGVLVLVMETEQVTDSKHPSGPTNALSCLNEALKHLGLKPTEVSSLFVADHSGLDRHPAVQVELHGLGGGGGLTKKLGGVSEVFSQWNWPDIGLLPDCPVYVVCHSIAHFAGAVYMSGFASCCALVYDGYGTCCGTMAYDYRDGVLNRLNHWHDKFLIGLRYSSFGWYVREIDDGTSYLDLAGKVMGLHAYGSVDLTLTAKFKAAFRRNNFWEYQSVTNVHVGQYEDFINLGPLYPPGLTQNCLSAKNPDHLSIIASMQEAVCELVEEEVGLLLEETQQTNLLMSGGCAMNIVVNDRIARLPNLGSLFIPPNCDDRGIAMGAAVIGNSAITGTPLHHPNISLIDKRNPFKGVPFLNNSDVNSWRGKKQKLFANNPTSIDQIASLLAKGGIIGLIVPYSREIGARALGRRSILASADYPNMKEIINTKIKIREWWRPFAPVCCVNDIDEYFDVPRHDPYMILGGRVRRQYQDRLSAITHVDGSARVQCLTSREVNPILWDLLVETKEKTGIGVLINTSLNLGGRPMVNNTKAMLEFIDVTKIDGVWIGDFFLSRNNADDLP